MKPESPAIAKRYIEIPYEDLHQDVRKQIDTLFSMRKVRLLQSTAGAFALGLGFPLMTSLNLPPLMLALFATGGATGYAIGSGAVGSQMKRIGEAVVKNGFVAEGVRKQYERMPALSELKKTHKAFYVDWKRNVTIVPDTKLERLAQRLALGRKRVTY